MNNKMQHYERFYKKWQDAIADVGGIAEFINLVAVSISYFYNNYIIIADTEVLLSSFNNYEKNNTNNIRKNNLAINIKKNNEFNNDNNSNNISDTKNNKINNFFF